MCGCNAQLTLLVDIRNSRGWFMILVYPPTLVRCSQQRELADSVILQCRNKCHAKPRGIPSQMVIPCFAMVCLPNGPTKELCRFRIHSLLLCVCKGHLKVEIPSLGIGSADCPVQIAGPLALVETIEHFLNPTCMSRRVALTILHLSG